MHHQRSGAIQNATDPMRYHHATGRRRFRSAKAGTIHASQGIANAFACLYFKLAGGTSKQRQAASEFKEMVLSMGGGEA